MKLSIVIPTFNRSVLLYKTLESITCKQHSDIKIEIIVVDNNSTDDTKKRVTEFSKNSKFRVNYILEKNKGLHYARNAGISKSSGEIIVFLDDDVILSQNFLSNISKEFDKHAQTAIVGGRILPGWEQAPPPWIKDFESRGVCAALSYLDYGKKRRALRSEYLFGCSMAVRRSVIKRIGGSDPDTFPSSQRHLQGSGENSMIKRARDVGLDVVYLPRAVITHRVAKDRMTIKYFLDRYERFAYETVNSEIVYGKIKLFKLLKKTTLHLANNLWFIVKTMVFNVTGLMHKEYYLVMSYYYLIQIKHILTLLCNKKIYNQIRSTR